MNTPDTQHLSLLNGVSFEPIFIVGDHRSGTTLLHRLLAETGCFNYVSAYHVIRYDSVLSDHLDGQTATAQKELLDEFQRLGLKDRIIDATPAVPEAPIEYGFILADESNRRPRITETTLPKFRELARKIQFVSDPAKPLLLKNPWDVICFMDIKRWFPNARFVFIHRHPVNVLNSQLRAIRSMLSARNPFAAMIAPWYRALYRRPLQLWVSRKMANPPIRLWDRLLGHHTARMAKYYMANHKQLPASDSVSLQYEELCRKPQAEMDRVLAFLGVQPAAPIDWAAKIAPREPVVLPEAMQIFRSIRDRVEPYLLHQGYSLDPR